MIHVNLVANSRKLVLTSFEISSSFAPREVKPISWLNWAKLSRRFLLLVFPIHFAEFILSFFVFHIYFAESTLSRQTVACDPEAHGSSQAEENL